MLVNNSPGAVFVMIGLLVNVFAPAKVCAPVETTPRAVALALGTLKVRSFPVVAIAISLPLLLSARDPTAAAVLKLPLASVCKYLLVAVVAVNESGNTSVISAANVAGDFKPTKLVLLLAIKVKVLAAPNTAEMPAQVPLSPLPVLVSVTLT